MLAGKAFEEGSACGEPGLARSPSAMQRPDSWPYLHLVLAGVWASALDEMVEMVEEAARAFLSGGEGRGSHLWNVAVQDKGLFR